MRTTFNSRGGCNTSSRKSTMRKLLLVNMALATLAAGALTPHRAAATPLAAAAGAGPRGLPLSMMVR
jgi:hypothetical protein